MLVECSLHGTKQAQRKNKISSVQMAAQWTDKHLTFQGVI